MKLESIATLRRFINTQQLNTMLLLATGEEGEHFHALIDDWAAKIEAMPKTYEQDGMGDDAIAHLHYFYGGCDWWITECDKDIVQDQAFGFVNLNDPEMAEIGYISIVELLQNGIEFDLYWIPKPLREIKKGLGL